MRDRRLQPAGVSKHMNRHGAKSTTASPQQKNVVMDVTPGAYEVTLTHPRTGERRSCVVRVSPGSTVNVAFDDDKWAASE